MCFSFRGTKSPITPNGVSSLDHTALALNPTGGLPSLKPPILDPQFAKPAYVPWMDVLSPFVLGALSRLPTLVFALYSSLVKRIRTHSFVLFAVHETRRIFLSPFILKAPRRLSSFFRPMSIHSICTLRLATVPPHKQSLFLNIAVIVTGPPNGPVLFCMLSSVGVCRRLRCLRAGWPAAGPPAWTIGAPATGRVRGPATDIARRASTVTSR